MTPTKLYVFSHSSVLIVYDKTKLKITTMTAATNAALERNKGSQWLEGKEKKYWSGGY